MYKDNGYIYRVYRNKDTYHCEQFSIIYSNNEYIYYKSKSSKELEKVKRNFLVSKKRIEELIREESYIPKSFMSTDSFSREELNKYFKEEQSIEKKRNELELRRKYGLTKSLLKSIAVKYKTLTNEDIETVIKDNKLKGE